MHPFRLPGRAMFPFPDRHQFLEPLDGVPASGEGLGAMRATDGHGHTDLADFQPPQAMHQGDFADRPLRPDIRFDLFELRFRHAAVGLVIQCNCALIAGQIADGAEKGHDRAAARPADLLGQRGVIDRFANQRDHEPPLTGGRTATSAPGGTVVSSSAYSPFTPMAQRGNQSASAGTSVPNSRRSSATVAPSPSFSVTSPVPARSRARANKRTRTRLIRPPNRSWRSRSA